MTHSLQFKYSDPTSTWPDKWTPHHGLRRPLPLYCFAVSMQANSLVWCVWCFVLLYLKYCSDVVLQSCPWQRDLGAFPGSGATGCRPLHDSICAYVCVFAVWLFRFLIHTLPRSGRFFLCKLLSGKRQQSCIFTLRSLWKHFIHIVVVHTHTHSLITP